MRMHKLALLICVLLELAVIASAQMPMPKPAPELKQLDWMAGQWKLDGDVKPSPMGPGGKMTMKEDIHWMLGDFFLVNHSKYSSAGMGEGTGLSIMGYDADAKKFTYNEFNSWGEAGRSMGTVDGKTWTWLGEDPKMGKGKFIMNVTSPTSYTFEYDMSKDGTNWTTIMTGTATKEK
ncbi:MAG: DUF1579 family protein [Candidatus Korobacteraceae bacterium]